MIKIEILRSVGVKQGDNMAPILFLFLMETMMRLLKDIWERKNIEGIEFTRESDKTYHQGQIFHHDIKSALDQISLLPSVSFERFLLTTSLHYSLR